MGMPSFCTVCRAPTAASFSIDCIRWIQRLPCPPAQKSNALLKKMRICAGKAHIGGSDNARLNKMILWYSRRIIIMRTTDYAEQASENRVALSSPIIRAYISLCWNCQNCIYDCRGVSSRLRRIDANHIRGPCAYVDFFLHSRNRKGEST